MWPITAIISAIFFLFTTLGSMLIAALDFMIWNWSFHLGFDLIYSEPVLVWLIHRLVNSSWLRWINWFGSLIHFSQRCLLHHKVWWIWICRAIAIARVLQIDLVISIKWLSVTVKTSSSPRLLISDSLPLKFPLKWRLDSTHWELNDQFCSFYDGLTMK